MQEAGRGSGAGAVRLRGQEVGPADPAGVLTPRPWLASRDNPDEERAGDEVQQRSRGQGQRLELQLPWAQGSREGIRELFLFGSRRGRRIKDEFSLSVLKNSCSA